VTFITSVVGAEDLDSGVMKVCEFPEKLDPAIFRDVLLRLAPGLPEAAIAHLYDANQTQSYQSGEFLLLEGEFCRGVFLLLKGTVQLCLRQNARTYLEICEISDPAILGLSGTLLDERLVAGARALMPAMTAFIPRLAFLEALRKFPHASLAFSSLVIAELNSAYGRLYLLARLPRARAITAR